MAKLPQLHEIEDNLIAEGRYRARCTDIDGPKPDGYGKPAYKFMFKLLSGSDKGKNMDIRFVGAYSTRLVDIFTALNRGTYDPNSDSDDYVGMECIVNVAHVTKKRDGEDKTYANITALEPYIPSGAAPAPKPAPPVDDFNVDDDDDLV